jgi:hypothetical protein
MSEADKINGRIRNLLDRLPRPGASVSDCMRGGQTGRTSLPSARAFKTSATARASPQSTNRACQSPHLALARAMPRAAEADHARVHRVSPGRYKADGHRSPAECSWKRSGLRATEWLPSATADSPWQNRLAASRRPGAPTSCPAAMPSVTPPDRRSRKSKASEAISVLRELGLPIAAK